MRTFRLRARTCCALLLLPAAHLSRTRLRYRCLPRRLRLHFAAHAACTLRAYTYRCFARAATAPRAALRALRSACARRAATAAPPRACAAAPRCRAAPRRAAALLPCRALYCRYARVRVPACACRAAHTHWFATATRGPLPPLRCARCCGARYRHAFCAAAGRMSVTACFALWFGLVQVGMRRATPALRAGWLLRLLTAAHCALRRAATPRAHAAAPLRATLPSFHIPHFAFPLRCRAFCLPPRCALLLRTTPHRAYYTPAATRAAFLHTVLRYARAFFMYCALRARRAAFFSAALPFALRAHAAMPAVYTAGSSPPPPLRFRRTFRRTLPVYSRHLHCRCCAFSPHAGFSSSLYTLYSSGLVLWFAPLRSCVAHFFWFLPSCHHHHTFIRITTGWFTFAMPFSAAACHYACMVLLLPALYMQFLLRCCLLVPAFACAHTTRTPLLLLYAAVLHAHTRHTTTPLPFTPHLSPL